MFLLITSPNIKRYKNTPFIYFFQIKIAIIKNNLYLCRVFIPQKNGDDLTPINPQFHYLIIVTLEKCIVYH